MGAPHNRMCKIAYTLLSKDIERLSNEIKKMPSSALVFGLSIATVVMILSGFVAIFTFSTDNATYTIDLETSRTDFNKRLDLYDARMNTRIVKFEAAIKTAISKKEEQIKN